MTLESERELLKSHETGFRESGDSRYVVELARMSYSSEYEDIREAAREMLATIYKNAASDSRKGGRPRIQQMILR